MSDGDPRPPARPPARLPDRLVQVGAAVFLVGLLGLLAELVAAALGAALPAWVVQVPYLLGAGLALALLGVLLQARARRRTR